MFYKYLTKDNANECIPEKDIFLAESFEEIFLAKCIGKMMLIKNDGVLRMMNRLTLIDHYSGILM